jgi:uncharacterized membrane protein YfcA
MWEEDRCDAPGRGVTWVEFSQRRRARRRGLQERRASIDGPLRTATGASIGDWECRKCTWRGCHAGPANPRDNALRSPSCASEVTSSNAGPGLVFGVLGIGGSLLGSDLNKLVNPNVLLLAFAGLMLLAAGAMLQRSAQPISLQPSAPRAAGDGPTAKRLAGVATVGTVVGFMTGFFGVGGGFVVVPGLVLALGFGMPEAVGTSLLVIALNSVVALAARGGVTALDWHVVIPFTAAAMAGSVVGGGLAARVPAPALERIIAGLLVLVSVSMATKSILGLV